MVRKIRVLKPGESVPKDARRIHLYPFQNILNPRGGRLSKESLSLAIFEHLEATWEHWTDAKYSDNPQPEELFRRLIAASVRELGDAMDELSTLAGQKVR